MPKVNKNQICRLEIQGMTNEGNGVGRLEGYAVFVPETAVGDICEVKLVKCNKSYGFGKLTKVLSPSPDRCAADCALFPQCGGCAYRHIRYEAELRIKEDMVKDAFVRLGGIQAAVNGILGSARQEGYRNKAQYPVGRDQEGKIVSGFYAKRSHRIIGSGDHCALQPELFGRIHRQILSFILDKRISVYEETSRQGLIRHIYLRQGEVTGEVMVCIVATEASIPFQEELIAQLTRGFPEIRSIVINENRDDTNVILGNRCRTIFGNDTINDVLCGVRTELSPLSFYQVNQPQAEVLYQKAIEYASLCAEDVLLDLYCGAGTIGLAAAGRVKELIGVEIVPQAVENARENARRNGVANACFLCADAGSAAKTLAAEGKRPTVIMVDPPRKGLEQSVIEAIAVMCPERVVMISCNPATAARDTMLLEREGYCAQEITPVDLFPRTVHVECVVKLCRVVEQA